MNWFKHDTDASNDAKIKKLILKYGVEGYGIYFHCLELIAADISETNITFQLEHDSEIIADNLKIRGTKDKSGIEIVEEIMRYIIELGLFSEHNGAVFCFKLLKRLDSSMTSNIKFRKLITEAKANHDTIMIPSCQNHDTIMQEEIRKEEIRSEENITAVPAASPPKKKFKPPTVQEVADYCKEKGYGTDPEHFISYYDARGWKFKTGQPVVSWKACLTTWNKRNSAVPSITAKPTSGIGRDEIDEIMGGGNHDY